MLNGSIRASLLATLYLRPNSAFSSLRDRFTSNINTPSQAPASISVLARASNMNLAYDEFGDDSFLADFDVDAAVVSHQQSAGSNEIEATSSPLISKRPKVSTSPENEDKILQRCLQKYFGYKDFRTGQIEVIRHLTQHKSDVAVFWGTGQGKSLTYQIPALLQPTNVAIVISPLISLMQDQVHKLNGLTTEKDIAVFLGSAQQDAFAESRALAGDYNLVYVTPEKLLRGNFLESLAHHLQNRLCLFAIDEAHCVSEWGFDFRPEFRQVGDAVRNHGVLAQVPMIALTATAVPRVQQDIMASLRLRNPLVAKQSFDRTNLKIRVIKKSGGVPTAMKALLQELNDPNVPASKQSTIIYAATRSQVEEIAMFLQGNIRNDSIRVEAYHAGLSPDRRNDAHMNFLTGATAVIVATVAFGMGIDKPDTRRVIHFGPPKTLEEYHQQIGRSGRDGLPALCEMHVSEADFDRYKSDYYLGKLSGKALQATESSMAALRAFALDVEGCRRKALMDYFEEVPAFGERCGTCDTCLNLEAYKNDTQRDFALLGARTVLLAISMLNRQSLTSIAQVLSENEVEPYRYQTGLNSKTSKEAIASSKKIEKKKYPQKWYLELIAPLAQRGYISESSKTAMVSGFSRTWTVYDVTSKAVEALKGNSPIILPVPESARELERLDAEKRQSVLTKLQEKGIDTSKLPPEEVEKGEGPVIQSYTKWFSYLEHQNEVRSAQMESLRSVIDTWRFETAIKLRMAPASVLGEHLIASIAYTVATLRPGMKLDAASLLAAGVRNKEIEALTMKLSEWVDSVQPARIVASTTETTTSAAMDLSMVKEGRPWQYAVYKPQKKTGLATWESSYLRFMKGESPHTIAMTPTNGRPPVQVQTVVGHILDAIEHGRAVDLKRLGDVAPAPSEKEWCALQAAEVTTGMDVTKDPCSSGKCGEKWTMTEFLRPIVGDRVADVPSAERSFAERELFSLWCDRLKWYIALRRAGYEPSFTNP